MNCTSTWICSVYLSYFFIIPDFHPGISPLFERNLVQLHNWAFSVSLYSDADHCDILIQRAHTVTTNWHECTQSFPPHSVLEDLVHCQCRENTGISPWGRCLDERWEASAFHFVLQAKPVPLKHKEISSKGAEYLVWGCSCCLSHGGGSSLARKHFCWLFPINQDFYIKKAENRGNYFFLIIELCFPDGLVLLERWLNAVPIFSLGAATT